MEELEKVYEYLNKFANNKEIDRKIIFQNLFLLICQIIDTLGSYEEEGIKHILRMLNEYDFEKNREVK